MRDKYIKDSNYIVIQGYMINELDLKGNELLIYAIIYGFSQGDQWFTGSLQYLEDWTNSSRQGVINSLKNLLDKNLIIKEETVINNVKKVKYKIFEGSQKSLLGVVKKVYWGSQKSLPNNINNNININNKEENNIKEESIFDYYQQEIGQLSPNQYELINSYIDKYGEDKIKDAINTACNNNVKTFNYFNSVLTNGNYKKSKESPIPNWMDKENKSERVSEEELAELEKEFEIFN